MKHIINIISLLSLVILPLQAQVKLSLVSRNIALNEPLQLVLESDKDLKQVGMPNLPNFTRGNMSTSTNVTIMNGRMSKVLKLTQKYFPTKTGKFTIPNFTITVDGKKIPVNSFSVTVGPAKKRRQSSIFDFFNNNNRQPQEYISVKADAFFAVSSNKKEVYRGEPFTLTMAFYKAIGNRAPLEFTSDLGNQVAELSKKIKPSNCWEENSRISNVTAKRITIGQKTYQQYVIYQSTFFPFENETIKIPQVGLKMIKYDVAKQRTFWGRNQRANQAVFNSKPITIKVKDLPAHPFKNTVSVGDYELSEVIEADQNETLENFSYRFKISGQGNITAISTPQLIPSSYLNIYPEAETMTINRENGIVYGNKTFNYFVEAQETGEYALGDYLYWIYFNYRTEKYDTLIPQKTVSVKVNKQVSNSTDQTTRKPKQELIYTADNQIYKLEENNTFQSVANIFVVGFVLAFIFLWIRESKQQN